MAIRGVKQQPRPSRPGVEGVRDAGDVGSGQLAVGAVDLAGRRVGVTANSHKVIDQILDKTAERARVLGVPVAIGQRARNEKDVEQGVEFLEKNEEARDGLAIGAYDVVGGTAWLWAWHDGRSRADHDVAGAWGARMRCRKPLQSSSSVSRWMTSVMRGLFRCQRCPNRSRSPSATTGSRALCAPTANS